MYFDENWNKIYYNSGLVRMDNPKNPNPYYNVLQLYTQDQIDNLSRYPWWQTRLEIAKQLLKWATALGYTLTDEVKTLGANGHLSGSEGDFVFYADEGTYAKLHYCFGADEMNDMFVELTFTEIARNPYAQTLQTYRHTFYKNQKPQLPACYRVNIQMRVEASVSHVDCYPVYF